MAYFLILASILYFRIILLLLFVVFAFIYRLYCTQDEYQALQLALNSTEEKFRNIQREHQTLIMQLMQFKVYIQQEQQTLIIQLMQFKVYRVRAVLTPKLTLIFSHKKYK